MLQAVVTEGVSGIRSRLQRNPFGDSARYVALFAFCAAMGVVAGVNPTYGLVGAVAVAFMAMILADATLGLILFTVLSFLQVLKTGGASDNIMKAAGLLLFGSWVATVVTGRTARDSRALVSSSPSVVIAGIALVSWSTISIVWAGSSGEVLSDTLRYALNLLLIPIVFGTVRTRQHVFWLAGAFVVGAVISSVYGFLVPTTATSFDAGQLAGAIGDANAEAAVLVGAIALEFGLIMILRRAPVLRLLVIVAILISLAGTINTLSRSGLIALAAMMIAGMVVGGEWRRGAAILLMVTAVIGIGYYFTITSTQTRSRVTSSDTSGRSTIWTVGWRMVEAQPLLGVGSGNFPSATIHYLQAPGQLTRADLIVDTPKVAHNIYLEILAELGIPGLLAFLTIVLGSAGSAWRAAQYFRRSGDRDLELMSRCVVLAIVGFMTSNFFLSGQFSKQLWLVFAFGPALLGLARRQEASNAGTAEAI